MYDGMEDSDEGLLGGEDDQGAEVWVEWRTRVRGSPRLGVIGRMGKPGWIGLITVPSCSGVTDVHTARGIPAHRCRLIARRRTYTRPLPCHPTPEAVF